MFTRGMLGKKHSEKTKRKMSEKHLGIKFSEEHKRKIRENHARPMKGRKTASYIDGRSKKLSPARYGDDWFKIRLLIYKRDNYTCQKCGITMNETKKAHHIHHKIPFLISFDNSLNNLITLCPPCHGKADTRIMKELKNQKVEVN